MSKSKYLFKNMFLLTLSNFTTKLLGFFLVPLYTNVLSRTEYGTYDIINTTIVLLIPILTLNIMESSLRFALDKDTNKQDVFTISFIYFLKASLIGLVIIILNLIFNFSTLMNEYWLLIYLMFVINAFSGILVSFVRGINKIADISISSVLGSFVSIILNIIFLVPFKMGITGYFLANIIGPMAQCLYLFIKIKLWKYLRFHHHDDKLKKEMVRYSKPLIANSVAWWINNASDRYIVIWFCGFAANGVYSVGYKIPSILNIFQTIFNQAWTLSVVKDFDPDDKSGFFSISYNTYNFLMVFACSGLIIFDRLLAKILYAKDFYYAWEYVPFLMISIVFGALSGYIGGIFSAVKNSKIFATSTVIGAITNLLLNIVFVQCIGVIGAAIATAISYWVVWIIRFHHMKKYMVIKTNLIRDYISYLCLVAQSVILIVNKNESILLYTVESIFLILILIMYHKELRYLIDKFLRLIHKESREVSS